MSDIISYLNEKCIKNISENIQKLVDDYYGQPEDLTGLILGVKTETDRLGRLIVENILTGLDQALRRSPERRADWSVKETRPRKLVTTLGEIQFQHTLYTNKHGESSCCLLDELIGLEAEQRMTDDAEAAILEEAVQTSYEKAGQAVHHTLCISRQTVMNKIHELSFPEEAVPEDKRKVDYLYIEADEDHVALQFQEKKGDLCRDENGRKSNCAIAKLVYIHEGLEKDAPGSQRRHLVNPHYIGGLYSREENGKLWESVYRYLETHYELSQVKKIYLSADGGKWIQGAYEKLPGIEMVLDEFHLSKYLLKMTGFLNDSSWDARQELVQSILTDNKEQFENTVKKILALIESESGERRIQGCAEYIRSNWKAAQLRLQRKKEIIGCSAEGHVSHLFSSRMSSRPMGWSRTGLDQMCHLRTYVKNGGNVLELVRYQHAVPEREELPQAAGMEGLSCAEVLRSEKNRHAQLGRNIEAIAASVSAEVSKQNWYRSWMGGY